MSPNREGQKALMDGASAFNEAVRGDNMEEDGEGGIDEHGFTDRDRTNLDKVREMNFDNGAILLLNKINQNKRGGLTDEGVVIARTIREELEKAGNINDESMINLEMLELMEVKIQHGGKEKDVLLCDKPPAAQGGMALVKAACKHMVEKTAEKFPIPAGVKTDLCAQLLMVFFQAVSPFKQHVYEANAAGNAQGGQKGGWEQQMIQVMQGMQTALQSGGMSKVGDKTKRFDVIVLRERMRELNTKYHYHIEERSVPTLESLFRMDKAIKYALPTISTHENDQPEGIKPMRSRNGQEALPERATLELSEGMVQLNVSGRTGGIKNAGNKFSWCNGLVLVLNGVLIVGYDLIVSPENMLVNMNLPNKYVTPGPVRELIEAALECARTVNNAETLLRPMWEHFIRSVNHQDVYGNVHSVNSACGVMVEDIRKMTSQAQALVNMIQYRGPPGMQSRGGYGGGRGGGHQNRGGRGGIFQGKVNSFRGGRGAGRGAGWVAKYGRAWSCPCGFMTNYAERDSCYLCGAPKTGKAGQIEITNLVNGEEGEVEEVGDGGNQGVAVAAAGPRGSQGRGRGRGRGRG